MRFSIFILFITFNINLYSQNNKIFLPSENEYVSVIGNNYWSAEDTGEYFGSYEFINAAEDENGNPNGDGWDDKLYLEHVPWSEDSGGFGVLCYTIGEVEGWIEPMIDTIKNSRIVCEDEMLLSSSCFLPSDSHSGEFVRLKFKNKNGKLKETKGILIKRSVNNSYEYFYEKILKGSGNGNSKYDNSIMFGGNVLEFGISIGEFLKNFPEFKKYDPSEMEFFGRDSDVGLEVYSFIFKSNINIKEFDPFENMYVIFVKFKNDSLIEFELLSGHSDEGYAIADSILAQFTLSKKETDNDLEYDKLYYKKENLEAFSYYYETLYLTIKIKN